MVAVDDIQKGISVIICCYNSSSRLYETLKHLALQKTDSSLLWEIIVVDNASTDDTAAFAMKTWSNFNRSYIPLKIVNEKRTGLSFARQCGVEEAQFFYIVFCDDDNWLSENYLQTAYNLISEHPEIGAFGGLGEAVSELPFPGWFTKYEEAYSVGKQAASPGVINEKGYVCGAGMVTRKIVFENTVNDNFPSILSDRKGQALSGGGDVEYCLRLILQGFNIYYTEELLFKHFIPAYRLNETYRNDLFKGAADAQWILKEYFEAVKIKRANVHTRLQLITAAARDYIKSFWRRREPNIASRKLVFYLFNIGFKDRSDLALIKHFFRHSTKLPGV